MDWEFDHAPDGNIALTGELDLDVHREFTMGLAFGNSQHRAVTTLFQALGVSFQGASQALYGAMGARERPSPSAGKGLQGQGELISQQL